MDDRDKKISKPGMPPLPPGFLKPNLPQPPQGGRPPLPPGAPQFPSFGPAPFAAQFPQPPQFQQAQPAGDAAAEETRKIKEEKDKLEKKISDMEKLLSQEKEKALLATLKNQQDEALSSRVESSLKDIQDKMRRDRRDHEVEEERLSLKGKIKELEMRLAQERETWMQTLKNQLSERETQGRDVEGHFVCRLQEMERRWLDEKAQWQKEISGREETIRSLKSASERLREVEDEFRKLSLEKAMAEKEASKLKDEVARAEREKASVESYIKIIPDKEREIAELRSENALLRGRQDTARLESAHQEEKFHFELEKLRREIGDLQAEIGSISDRKNSEKNEELKNLQARFESQLQEKEKSIAEMAGEKARAISELVKIKGFIGRVQAINAVLEKERGQLRLEKMQLAQNMAAQLEEIKRLKHENDGFKASHQAELEAHTAKMRVEIDRVKNGYAAEMNRKHAEENAELIRSHQEEISKISAARQDELAATAAAAREAADRAVAAAKAAADRTVAERQAEFDAKLSQLRTRYEGAAEEEKSAFRRQLEAEHAAQLKEAREALAAAQETALKFELENRRFVTMSRDFEAAIAEREKDYEARAARAEARADRAEAEAARLEKSSASAAAQKEEAENYARSVEADRQRLAAEAAALREQYSALAAQKTAAEAEAGKLAGDIRGQAENLKAESDSRARFESEILALREKTQQLEFQVQETAAALEAEHAGLLGLQASAEEQRGADAARLAEMSAELERYKELEKSLAGRIKWAFTAKKTEKWQ